MSLGRHAQREAGARRRRERKSREEEEREGEGGERRRTRLETLEPSAPKPNWWSRGRSAGARDELLSSSGASGVCFSRLLLLPVHVDVAPMHRRAIHVHTRAKPGVRRDDGCEGQGARAI